MRKLSQKVPKLTKHRASVQGVVRLSGKDFYCGLFGNAPAQMEYDRITGEWLETLLDSSLTLAPTRVHIAQAFSRPDNPSNDDFREVAEKY